MLAPLRPTQADEPSELLRLAAAQRRAQNVCRPEPTRTDARSGSVTVADVFGGTTTSTASAPPSSSRHETEVSPKRLRSDADADVSPPPGRGSTSTWW